MNTTTDVVGTLATIVGTFLMLPQAIKSFRTRHMGDLSWLTIGMYFVNCILWAWHGTNTNDLPVVRTNVIAFFISLALLVMKIIWRKNPEPRNVKKLSWQRRAEWRERLGDGLFDFLENAWDVCAMCFLYPLLWFLKVLDILFRIFLFFISLLPLIFPELAAVWALFHPTKFNLLGIAFVCAGWVLGLWKSKKADKAEVEAALEEAMRTRRSQGPTTASEALKKTAHSWKLQAQLTLRNPFQIIMLLGALIIILSPWLK